ncbi:MAG: hypothetical protein IPN06_18125 [Burkholderiales bacterium]|nr:hypothetical protein [Burkholderiales bacterium]
MNEKTLYDYWMVCYRRKFTILIMVVTAVTGVLVIGASLPAIYEARAMFYVPSSAATQRSNLSATDVPLPTSNQDDAKANIGILKGRDTLRAIHAQFPQRSIDTLQRNVDFTAGRDGIIHVYARDRDPALAAAVANAYYFAFSHFLTQRMQERALPRTAAIRARLDDVERELQAVIASRNALAGLSGSPLLDTEATELIRERSGMSKELDELRGSDGQSGENNGRDTTSPVIAEMERQIAQIDMDLAKTRQKTLPNHPDQIALMKSRDAAVAALQEKMASLKSNKKTRSETVHSMLQKREQRLKAIPQYQSTLNETDQKYRDLRAAKSFLKNSLEEAILASSKAGEIGVIVETAQPPEVPVFPIVWLNVLIALIMSSLTGILYALLLDYVEDRQIARRSCAPAVAM